MEESIILEHNNCDVTEYNDILVVNTKINEKNFNEEIYVKENSDTIYEESLDLTFAEHGVTSSSSIISENLLFKKDTYIESDGNLIEEELQSESVAELEKTQNTEPELKVGTESVLDPLEVLEVQLLAAYEEAERNVIADQVILNRLNPANLANRLNFHNNPVLFNYLLQYIQRLYYGPVLAPAPILPLEGVLHVHVDADVRADADAGNENIDNNNVINNGNDNRVVIQVEVVGNVPAPLGSTYLERATLLLCLWLLFGLLLFSRLIPVYLVRGILYIFDQKDEFYYLIRRICIEFDFGGAHLVLPLTFESLNYWSRCHFYIEFVIGLSIIATVSSWAGEWVA